MSKPLPSREELRKLELTALPPSNAILPLRVPPHIPPARVPPPRPDAHKPFGAALPDWSSETFVVPAAYPRSVPGSVRSKAERARGPRYFPTDVWESTVAMITRQVEASFVNAGFEGDTSEEPIHLVVNRYAPRTGRRSLPDGEARVSAVLIHGTMLCKELFEPTITELVARGEVFDEVWALDTFNSGESAYANGDKLGYQMAWEDYGRDVVAFLRSPIFQKSFGGTALLFAAALQPDLFTSITLLEPVSGKYERTAAEFAQRSLKRRSIWPSRDAALAGWRTSPRFKRCDERSLALYGRFGLRDVKDPDGKLVTVLSTSKEDEALQFATPYGSGPLLALKTFSTLPKTLPVTVLYAGYAGSLVNDAVIEAMRAALPHARTWRVDGLTHYMVEESPGRLAEELSLVWRDPERAKL